MKKITLFLIPIFILMSGCTMISHSIVTPEIQLGDLDISDEVWGQAKSVKILGFDFKINEGKSVSIKPKTLNQDTKRLWGMNRSLLNNAIIGTSIGYSKILELSGVGYRAALKGKDLSMQLGYSHDVIFNIPENVKITVEKQTTIKINGSDKQEVGMVASQIRSLRPPEPYKGKGIKEQGQYVLRKEGKKK